MKKLAPLAFALIALCSSVFTQAQSQAKWKEMDVFHDIMGATFHPAEDGNLQPIRTRNKEMLEKAVAWKKAAVPQGYDQAAVSASLKKLVKGAKEIDKLVKANATDKELTDKLSALHDVFHEIMEKCRKEDHH